MRKHLISNIILALLICSILGIGVVLIYKNSRTPTEYWELAQIQLAEKNYRAALRNLTKAADGDIPEAQYQLALLYDIGDKIPADQKKAIYYMSLASWHNDKNALYAMGVWIERGYFGDPNTPAAIVYYKKAAKRGHINAMRSLIARYDEGFGGFPDNLKQKAYWLNQLKKQENKK